MPKISSGPSPNVGDMNSLNLLPQLITAHQVHTYIVWVKWINVSKVTHTRARTHARTHAHTHTHIHTQTQCVYCVYDQELISNN